MLWPTLETARDMIRVLAPPAVAAPLPERRTVVAPLQLARAVAHPMRVEAMASVAPAKPFTPDRVRLALAAASFLSFGRAVPIEEDGAVPPPLRPTPASPTQRLTGSAWAILREGVAGGLPGGQLGGSQVGVRLVYALDRTQHVALSARVSAPLEGRGAEAAIGVELRPAHLPLRIIAEQRIAIDGGRGGTALYAVGGTNPVLVAAGFRLEAYAQAGVVVRGDAHGFADGAARLTRPLSRGLDLGVGAWGGAQPGVSRVDVGPTVGIALPVAGRNIRLSLDWRQRVAGHARPGSGPALSIGSDF